MSGVERRRRRTRPADRAAPAERAGGPEAVGGPETVGGPEGAGGPDRAEQPPDAPVRRPSPHDLADRGGAFAVTASVHDPDEAAPAGAGSGAGGGAGAGAEVVSGEPDREELTTERGLRGLVGGGSSQVTTTAAMRARDAARPTEADLAAAEANLTIIRRGWVPREDLPRPGRPRS